VAGKTKKWRGKRPDSEHHHLTDRCVITPQCHSHIDKWEKWPHGSNVAVMGVRNNREWGRVRT
jgi:hypothetical protein